MSTGEDESEAARGLTEMIRKPQKKKPV